MSKKTIEQMLDQRLARPLPWLVLLMVLMAIQVSGWWWHPGGDDVSYLSMARSFATTGHMRNLGNEHLYYAPGYAVLISPTFWLSSRPFLWISLEQMLMAWAAIIAIYYWARRWTGRASAAVLIAAFVVVNANFWQYYRQNLSETAFICVMMLAGLCLQRSLESQRVRSIIGWTMLGALLTALLGSIRHVGVLLAGGYAVAAAIAAWRGRVSWRRAIACGAMVAMVAATVVAIVIMSDRGTVVHPDPQTPATYWNQMFHASDGLLGRALEGLHRRVNTTGQLLVPGLFKTYASAGEWLNPIILLYGAVAAVMLLGWARMARARLTPDDAQRADRGAMTDPLVWMMPMYVGLYVVWPYNQGTRFFVPLLPLFGVIIYQATRQWPKQQLCILTALVLTHLGAAGVRWASQWPEAARDNAHWSQLADVGQPAIGVTSVGMVGLRDTTATRLTFIIDRHTERADDARAINPHWSFVLTASDHSPLSEFATVKTAGPWTMWQRTAYASSDSLTPRR